MDTIPRRVLFLLIFVVLAGCFGITWFLQWWTILTMTRVGTIGTLTGCVSFCPSLVLLNMVTLLVALKGKSGEARTPYLLLVLIANALLMLTGISTIFTTVNSLADHTSYFTPRKEDLAWDEWLGLFATFVLPEILFIGYSIFALSRFKGRKKRSTDSIETEAEPSR
jgi:hypothetical protein